MGITQDEIVQIIGEYQFAAEDPYQQDDQYAARGLIEALRKAIGLDKRAIIRWDDGTKRFIVITAKKAVARAGRK